MFQTRRIFLKTFLPQTKRSLSAYCKEGAVFTVVKKSNELKFKNLFTNQLKSFHLNSSICKKDSKVCGV